MMDVAISGDNILHSRCKKHTASVVRSQDSIASMRCCLRFATSHRPQQFNVTTFMPGAALEELTDGMSGSP